MLRRCTYANEIVIKMRDLDLPGGEKNTREPIQMITKNRPDFIYTLDDDERRCLASIEKEEQRFKERHERTSIHK